MAGKFRKLQRNAVGVPENLPVSRKESRHESPPDGGLWLMRHDLQSFHRLASKAHGFLLLAAFTAKIAGRETSTSR